MGAPLLDISAIDVIVPNFKRRLSGVTSTIIQLVPLQARTMGVATLGPGLPEHLPRMRWWQVPRLFGRPKMAPVRVWHARRNTEMIGGLLLRDVLRAPVKLVFTSAAQRHHKPFTKWLIRRMDAVVATSHVSGSYLDVPHTVIMHGIDLDLFSPPDDRSRAFEATGLPGRYAVGCFGRIRHQKGTDLFVDAMIDLLPDHPDWSAIITGRTTGPHAEFAAGLKEKVRAAGLEDRIRFLGEVPDVRTWFRSVHLCVAPSRNEGFGLTPLEAMASGAPVVSSDAGAYRELVAEGLTGRVVAAGDGDALREAIRGYLENPEETARQGRAAVEHVTTNFPLDREAEQLRSIYRRLLLGEPG